MSRKFIPESDSEFLAMAAAFAAGIAADPPRYALTSADAATIVRAVDEYKVAFWSAKNPEKRTVGAVKVKNQSRSAAAGIIRTYANSIRAHQGVSDDDRIAIGIPPRTLSLRKRPCPQSSPLLKFIGGETGRHGLRYSDSNTPTSRAKPFGAHALQLFMAISDYGLPPTRDPSKARYVGEYGRNPIVVNHNFEDGGKTATYFARWVGARNEHGPWSLPVTAIVMFAGSTVTDEAARSDFKLAA